MASMLQERLSMLKVLPLTLKQANELVASLHRHHKPAQGHRFSIGCEDENGVHGAAICGRPVARGCDPYRTLEVVRLVTDGTPNACSILYATAARIAKDMGFHKIQTYILASEPGTSLKASGWVFAATTAGGNWNHSKANKGTRRIDQPMESKSRWERVF